MIGLRTRMIRGILGMVLFGICVAGAQDVPSFFRYEIALPAGVRPLSGPSSVFVCAAHDEVYIADTGNDRIVILDGKGRYVFEFGGRPQLAAPRQVAADSRGRIFVLGEGRADRLKVFDYDGTYLRDIVLHDAHAGTPVELLSFTIHNDRVYGLISAPLRVHVCTTDGEALRSFPVLDERAGEVDAHEVPGRIAVVNDKVLVPLPMTGTVFRFTLEGQRLDAMGVPGASSGELSFPVAACADGWGGVLVLDKHRHTILQYRDDGRFVREWGGLGTSPGWFYHPSELAADKDGHCFVLQTFGNRIQNVCVAGTEIARSAVLAADGE